MSKKNKTNTTNAATPKQRRRWLNIGPGIVIALAISALIGSQWIKTEMAARQQHSAPPIVESQVVTSSYEEKSGPTPEIGFIVDRAQKLQITNTQLNQLEALQDEWKKVYGPKMAEANAAADKTNKYLTDAKNHPRIPVAQIQDAAAPVVALSREISTARLRYWDRAMNVLTSEQRRIVQGEREADWAAKKEAITKAVKKRSGQD